MKLDLLLPRLTPLALAALALAGASGAHAQSATLRFAGSSHADVPLLSSADLIALPSGSFEGRCVLVAGTTRCQNISGSGTTGPLPAISLSAPSSATTGAAITVGRSAASAPELCVASSAPASGVSGWSGSLGPGSGSSSVTFAASGTYSLSMRCYNANGASSSNAVSINVTQGGGTTPGNCSISHPRIRPQGFTEHVRTWPQVFNGFAYPLTQSRPTPVGSFSVTLNQASSPPSAGMYLSIPVTLPADRTLRIFTTLVTGTENFPGYTQPRQGNVFVALSPCAGDLRALDPQSSEVFLRCRGMMAESSVSFSSRIFPGQGCHNIPPGPYWLTVMHADPSAPGFGPFTNTCFNGDRCENGFTVDLF